MDIDIVNLVKVLAPAAGSFFVGIAVTPAVTHYLYKYKAWKKRSGNVKGLGDNKGTPIFNRLHKDKEISTPRMGGVIIVLAVFLTIVIFWLVSYFLTGGPSGKIDFLSRSQTWLPFFAFIIGALIGFVEDIFQIKSSGKFQGGLPFSYRVVPILFFGLFAAYWFYIKLEISEILIPFYGMLDIGIWFIPLFLLVLLFIYATGIIDGIDGVSGGVLSSVFAAFGVIALFQSQVDISAFSFVIVGAILAFLWFNIPPARFYLGEAGFTSLALALTIIVFMTGQVFVLPIIAFVQFATVVTTFLQVASKKFRGKKIFLVAPIHHHFEAIGWPGYKVAMRYWIISVVFAILGMIIALIG